MRNFILFFVLLCSFGTNLYALNALESDTSRHSAVRGLDQDWRTLAKSELLLKTTSTSIYEESVDWNKADLTTQQALLSQVPTWPNYQTIQDQFNYLKNHRFLIDPIDSEVTRTIPWRYVVDYCFERAATAVRLYNTHNLPRPAKVFAFGKLALLSPYAPRDGMLRFWYHVAPVIRDGETNEIYVLDPALNYDVPSLLSEWLEQLVERSDNKETWVNICNGYGSVPSDNCRQSSSANENYFQTKLPQRLPNEWDMLQSKGINSQLILGTENPHPSGKMIYGSIFFDLLNRAEPFAGDLIIQYKSHQDTNWQTIFDIQKIKSQMTSFSYRENFDRIPIGSIYGKTSRTPLCQCNYHACYCEVMDTENKIDLRVLLNNKILKECTYQYPTDKTLVNYQEYGPDIHYKFNIQNGKIDPDHYSGTIDHCQ